MLRTPLFRRRYSAGTDTITAYIIGRGPKKVSGKVIVRINGISLKATARKPVTSPQEYTYRHRRLSVSDWMKTVRRNPSPVGEILVEKQFTLDGSSIPEQMLVTNQDGRTQFSWILQERKQGLQSSP